MPISPSSQATAQRPAGPPLRAIRYAPVSVACEPRPDGGTVLRSREPLGQYDTSVARLFRAAVERRPDHPFLAERDSSGSWRKLTYGEARPQAERVAQALIDRGLSAERPVMVLSGNAIEHGIVNLACFTAGIPVAPVSVAYSLQSRDHAKLKHIVGLLTPGLIYVADTGPFAKSLAALALAGVEVVAGRNGANLEGVTAFDELARTTAGPAVEKAVAAARADTIAKFLFTSGSTGFPKAVINTHGMMTANQQQVVQTWPFLHDDDLVLADWLPWSHTFAGNHNFNLILRHAGTLYLDPGKPVPDLIKDTVRTLSEVSPTIYLSVPAGYAALLPHLEQNEALAQNFFKRLRLIFYAAAALPQDLWERLDAVALRTTGERIPMTSSWGATETAPMATAAHYLLDRAGNIGVPAPGIALKLVPSGDKLEVRVRGPNVTPGYWRQPELTAAAFDEEGFYKIGDAVRLSRSKRAGQGPDVRRPAGGRFQADDRHVRASGPAPRRSAGGCLAGAAGRRGRRREPRPGRPAAVAQSGRMPEAARHRRSACACGARRQSARARARQPRGHAMERRSTAHPRRGSRASCCCRMRPRSTPTRSPTRAMSTSASRSSAARPTSNACSPPRRTRT